MCPPQPIGIAPKFEKSNCKNYDCCSQLIKEFLWMNCYLIKNGGGWAVGRVCPLSWRRNIFCTNLNREYEKSVNEVAPWVCTIQGMSTENDGVCSMTINIPSPFMQICFHLLNAAAHNAAHSVTTMITAKKPGTTEWVYLCFLNQARCMCKLESTMQVL